VYLVDLSKGGSGMSMTAKELAKLLNLSEAAISMALHNKPGVSTRTRKKVLEAAKENGYDFSRIEESFSQSSYEGTVHFIIYKKSGAVVGDTPFFSQLSEGVGLGLKESPYHLNVSYLYGEDRVENQLSDLVRSGSKGILLLGTEMSEHDFKPFTKLPIPLVVLDTSFEHISTNCVLIDNVQGAFFATDYLIKKCKAQPGYLQSSYPITNFLERSDGFYKAVRQNGMSSSKTLVHRLTPSMEGAYADMTTLLEQGEAPTRCYFADNDFIAAGAMKAFRDFGYRIPQDVAIAGFDNLPISTIIEPTLTTIHVPKQSIGMLAARRLVELITDKIPDPVKILVGTNLVPRKSV
jgi:LacI family transcriptional regulator